MDVFYDQFLFGRNEASGLWSNQRMENQGGFKSVTWFGTNNNLLMTANLFIEIPYVPLLGVFADYGVAELAGSMESVYNAGIGFKFEDKFGIYFPLVESQNIIDAWGPDVKFAQKIRFTLNLTGLNPGKIIQSLPF